jgi:signal peptidase
MEALPERPIRIRAYPRSTTWGRAIRLACSVVFVVVVAAWTIFLRPESLGGSANYLIVAGHSMEPTLHTGDLVLARRQHTYRLGDVIAYRITKGQPGAGVLVIHRIVGGSMASGYMTQGDNSRYRDPWRPKARDIDGKWTAHVPGFGLLAFFVHRPLGFALFGGLVTFLVLRGRTDRPTNDLSS